MLHFAKAKRIPTKHNRKVDEQVQIEISEGEPSVYAEQSMKNTSAVQIAFSPLTVTKIDVCRTVDRSPQTTTKVRYYYYYCLIHGGFMYELS